jgi:aspartate-semialdehyde dehydrogenase
MMKKIKVAILGSTGMVGQAFVWLLAGHDRFEISFLSASAQRDNKYYGDEVQWVFPFPMPQSLINKKLAAINYRKLKELGVQIIFSALPAAEAKTIEQELRALNFYVFSNAGALRYEEDVPILIPEVNIHALSLIEKQGFPEKGFVVTNANCSTTGLVVALSPLIRFGIEEIYVSTYQSVSGAGYPGISALDISGNAIPHIKNEEEKMIAETKKILEIEAGIYPTCVRIPTLWGHLETVWIKFREPIETEDIVRAWQSFKLDSPKISSMPENPIIYRDEAAFPQPKMSFFGAPPGMTVFTGQLKKRDNKFGFTLLVNNIIKGAAGGSIQNAEAFVGIYGGGLQNEADSH